MDGSLGILLFGLGLGLGLGLGTWDLGLGTSAAVRVRLDGMPDRRASVAVWSRGEGERYCCLLLGLLPVTPQIMRLAVTVPVTHCA